MSDLTNEIVETNQDGAIWWQIRHIDWADGRGAYYALSVSGHGLGWSRDYRTLAGARRGVTRFLRECQ